MMLEDDTVCARATPDPPFFELWNSSDYISFFFYASSLVSRARLDAHAPAALFAAHSSCSSQVGRGEYEPMKLLK